MIKDIKKNIFDMISAGIPLVPYFYQSDNENENNFDTKMPLITWYRLSSRMTPQGQRADQFQLTAWWSTNLEAEWVMQQIVTLFNRTQNLVYKHCKVDLVGPELFDKDVKAYGIPVTLTFIMADNDF